MHRCLAAWDLSDTGKRAAHRAARIAADRQSGEVILLHVRETPEYLSANDPALSLSTLAQELADRYGISVTPLVEQGAIAPTILGLAAKMAASLVVLGPTRTGPLSQFFRGSTIQAVLASLSQPTLIVRHPAEDDYHHIIAALDLSRPAKPLLQAMAEVSAHATLEALTLVPAPPRIFGDSERDLLLRHERDTVGRAWEDIDALLKEVDLPHERCRITVETGDAQTALARLAASADLLVLGPSGKGYWEKMIFGSVTEQAIADLNCDILAVPVTG